MPMKAQYWILAFFVLFYILDTTSSEAADIENSHFMDSKEVWGTKRKRLLYQVEQLGQGAWLVMGDMVGDS